ncbi:hypothetical protein [Pseudotabrizicola sp. 4114]|uniref:hypothetical protein n=1 Tax=Pseudotabrizicola sp. 4114 TaxID=2817731 RepID=UPI00285751DF|nr:hypothetical protein [Pseudorhodobacter sp. 4114]
MLQPKDIFESSIYEREASTASRPEQSELWPGSYYAPTLGRAPSPSAPAMDYIVVLLDPSVGKIKLTDLDIGELLGTTSHPVINFIRDSHFELNLNDTPNDTYKSRDFTVWNLIIGVIVVYYLVFDADDVEFISESIKIVEQLIDAKSEPEVIYNFAKFINVPLDRLQHRRGLLLQDEGVDFEELLFSCLKVIQRYYLRSFCSTSKASLKREASSRSICGGKFQIHFQLYHHYLGIARHDPLR